MSLIRLSLVICHLGEMTLVRKCGGGEMTILTEAMDYFFTVQTVIEASSFWARGNLPRVR